jgi:hypothetical protein
MWVGIKLLFGFFTAFFIYLIKFANFIVDKRIEQMENKIRKEEERKESGRGKKRR